MNEAIKILKTIGLVGLVIVGLSLLGVAINNILPWSWLTDFFRIIRHFVGIFDFMWDTSTFFVIIGLGLLVEVAYWVFKAVMWAIRWFKSYQ
jgi:hypothetical protein